MSGKYGIEHLTQVVAFLCRLINIITGDISQGWSWFKEIQEFLLLVPGIVNAIANLKGCRPELADLQPDERNQLISEIETLLKLPWEKAQTLVEDALAIIAKILDWIDKIH
jgi:hypothetical protein